MAGFSPPPFSFRSDTKEKLATSDEEGETERRRSKEKELVGREFGSYASQQPANRAIKGRGRKRFGQKRTKDRERGCLSSSFLPEDPPLLPSRYSPVFSLSPLH